MKFLFSLFLLIAASSFGAVPSYTSFRGTGGIFITTNPPTGLIVIDGSGIFTSSGTNATIATSTNGVLVAVASTNINFVRGSNVFLAATNIGSTTHIAINAFTPVPFIEGAVTNLLLTWILPILTVDSLTVSNLLAAPPLSSVQYNSNGITRGSAGFIYTNGQVRVADIVVAGQGMEVTSGSFVLNGGDTALVAWNGLGRMRWPTGGVARLEDDAALSFNRLQLGGDTAAFPAIGRTNGDIIILGANGAFKSGDATNKLRAPAVFIANDGGMGTPLLRLENPLNGIAWDLEINSHAETYILGLGFNDETYAMVWELNGNVGIGITNPTVRLDVQGRFMARSNVYFPNISSNALPVAFLATDSDGQVYETAVPAVGGSGASTNAVLTNLVGTAGNNVTNVVSLSTSNATSKPLTNSYTTGVLTLFGVEAGANVTVTPNGSNLVIAATGGASTPGGNSGAIQFNEGGAFAGTNLFVFNRTNGNVGILTASPVATLDVNGTLNVRGDFSAVSTTQNVLYGYLNNNKTSGQADSILTLQKGTAGYSAYVYFGHLGGAITTEWQLGTGITAIDDVFKLRNADGTTIWQSTDAAGHALSIFPGGSGNVGIGTNAPFSKLDVVGGIRSHTVTASRMAAFHTDKTITNGATTVALLDNFFAMGITNIVAADANIVIRTNAGSLTISNSAAGSGTFAAGNSNQIPFINGAQTGYQYAGYLSQTNPGFGFNPVGPQGGYGGLMVFARDSMGLVTIGHPNPASDFTTFHTALVVSNRFAGAADFKNDMVKIEVVLVGGNTYQADSTLTRWRVWNGTTSSNDVAELTVGGVMKLAGGIKVGTNGATLTNTLYASATLNFPSTVAGTVSDLPITLVGAADGDIVALGEPSGSIGPLTGVYNAWASNDVVYVRFANNNPVTAQDPASGVFKVRVDKFQ